MKKNVKIFCVLFENVVNLFDCMKCIVLYKKKHIENLLTITHNIL